MQYEILVSNISFSFEQENKRGADETLEQKVNEYIAQGWRPQGGVSTIVVRRSDHANDYNVVQQYQAMVKD